MCNILSFSQLKTISKLGFEGYTLILNKATSENKVMCSSDIVQEFVSCEEQRGQAPRVNNRKESIPLYIPPYKYCL